MFSLLVHYSKEGLVDWTFREATLRAERSCTACRGSGALAGESLTLCRCVYRTVFRECHRWFRRCIELDVSARTVSLERIELGVDRCVTWVRRNEDYIADFHAAGRRVLPAHLYRVFSFYHLHGATREVVARRLGLSPRALGDWISEAEVAVGREIAHQQPYSIFPPRRYWLPSGMPLAC
jgi:hypothetical protein